MFVINCMFVIIVAISFFFFFFKQKTAYEMRISDWSSDVCSSDLRRGRCVALHVLYQLVVAQSVVGYLPFLCKSVHRSFSLLDRSIPSHYSSVLFTTVSVHLLSLSIHHSCFYSSVWSFLSIFVLSDP